jgi:lambda repressor-like predicted transcriptional regulator
MSMAVKNQATKKNPAGELLADNVRIFLEVKNAFEQCDDEIKQAVLEMVAIYQSEDATEDEKRRAMNTIIEAIFPGLAADFLGFCESVRTSKTALDRSREMAEEEASFATQVQRLMHEKKMTQEQLAEKSGVGQSAISNMINRECRPQRKTVIRMAEALGVSPQTLWPSFVAD